MNETEYHRLADTTLETIAQMLEKADEDGALELEHESGMVTVELENGKQFIVSKHAPTRQLWLSSPLSGGLHFSYDDNTKDWRLADQRSIVRLLMDELKTLAGVKV